MSFWDRFKTVANSGLQASKTLLEKAGNTARDIGEMGILRIEIRELENKVRQTLSELGLHVSQAVRLGAKSISASDAKVAELVANLDELEAAIRSREEVLAAQKLKNKTKS